MLLGVAAPAVALLCAAALIISSVRRRATVPDTREYSGMELYGRQHDCLDNGDPVAQAHPILRRTAMARAYATALVEFIINGDWSSAAFGFIQTRARIHVREQLLTDCINT